MSVTVYIYSHTHWDREWYLSQNQFQFRLIRTVDEIIEMLLQDNVFATFVLDGQTSVLDDYLELRPEQEETIRQLVQNGQLAIGPWYTMPDLFIPDGESLIRNLLRGFRHCLEFGAPYPNLGYVPDSFGHIEQMPQILRGVGIDNYVFSRGRPVCLAPEKGHKREFIWIAPDGSMVFAWPLPAAYGNAMFLPSPEEPEALRLRVTEAVKAFQNSHRPDIVLMAHGIDHCWLQGDMPDILALLPRLCPELDFQHGSLQDALDAWKKVVPKNLQQYRGPLRGRLTENELHGTLSSRIDNKIANEQAQMQVENLAEPLEALAVSYGKRSSAYAMDKAWKLLLQNHAHDSICGCSQDRVHRDVNRRFRETIELGIDVADQALDYLNSAARREKVPTLVVYAGLNGGNKLIDFVVNCTCKPVGPVSFEDAAGRRWPVQIDTMQKIRVEHTTGNVFIWECRGVVYIADLQPCEVRKLRLSDMEPTETAANTVFSSKNTLKNGHLEIAVATDGRFSMRDLANDREIGPLHYLQQETDIGGGYHFEPLPRTHKRTNLNSRAKISLHSSGALRSVLRIDSQLRVPQRFDLKTQRLCGKTTIPIRTELMLEADNRLLKIKTTIENRACDQRIRLILPTGMSTTSLEAESSFAVTSNSIDNWPADEHQNSHPMRNFLHIAENGRGLTFVGRGLHEYEIQQQQSGTAVAITLLRSVEFVRKCCTWQTPEAQLRQPITVEYALAMQASWRDILTEINAFRHPAIANMHGDAGNPQEHMPYATTGFFLQLDNGREQPLDSNRSAWKMYNANRDGWRRLEKDRYACRETPPQIRPFSLQGRNLFITACKNAADGTDLILRFCSYHDKPQTVTLSVPDPRQILQQTNLLEQDLDGVAPTQGGMELSVKPFELVTVRLKTPEL